MAGPRTMRCSSSSCTRPTNCGSSRFCTSSTASRSTSAATREVLQSHFGAATLQKDPEKYLAEDFAALMETMALAGGMKLEPENKQVPSGLE